MGVYINMKMPKSCAECDIVCRNYLDRGLDGFLAKICRIESRLPECPLTLKTKKEARKKMEHND